METKTFNQKLFELQNDIEIVKKDNEAKAGSFQYKYFDINGLLAMLRPLLKKHRLIIQQPLAQHEGRATLQTWIKDADSEDSFVTTAILPENPDPQKMGGIITYFRRYALQSMLLLQAEDDDAASSSGDNTAQPKEKKFYKKHCPVCDKDYNTAYEQAKTCFPCKDKPRNEPIPVHTPNIEEEINVEDIPF